MCVLPGTLCTSYSSIHVHCAVHVMYAINMTLNTNIYGAPYCMGNVCAYYLGFHRDGVDSIQIVRM